MGSTRKFDLLVQTFLGEEKDTLFSDQQCFEKRAVPQGFLGLFSRGLFYTDHGAPLAGSNHQQLTHYNNNNITTINTSCMVQPPTAHSLTTTTTTLPP